jgi:hydroxymethylpyrimidine pyrophosphatase-like HAD family hydrolase
MIKALAFDLDNTLLDRGMRIGPRTWRALQAWLEAGGTIFLATSRPLRSVRRDVPADFLDRCCLITLNGSVSQTSGGTPRAHGTLGAAARAIVGHAYLARQARLSVEIDGLAFGSRKGFHVL